MASLRALREVMSGAAYISCVVYLPLFLAARAEGGGDAQSHI